jgi:hypothetical protein
VARWFCFLDGTASWLDRSWYPFTIGWLSKIRWWVYLLSSVPSLSDYGIKLYFLGFSFGLCLLVLLQLLGERLLKSVQRSFCTVCRQNDWTWGNLKKLDNEFLVSKQ